jgi:hypothetical protein
MNTSSSNPPLPSEYDDEVDDAELPHGTVWAYPCKYPLCPDYGKSWQLRSNFLLHLQEQNAHATTATTVAVRRAIEKEWRYLTDPNLPPRNAPNFQPRDDPEEDIWNYNFRDDSGRIISGRGTMKQIEMHKASRRLQLQGMRTSS